MGRATYRVLLVSALAAPLLAASCGGKAIVDEAPAVDQNDGGQGGGSPVCSTPAPVGALVPCGGTDGSSYCSVSLCDQQGNVWESSCTPEGCSCVFNFEVRCSCAAEGPGQLCDGVTPACCPLPFP